MRQVAVIGAGMIHFGELWAKPLRQIWAEAASESDATNRAEEWQRVVADTIEES